MTLPLDTLALSFSIDGVSSLLLLIYSLRERVRLGSSALGVIDGVSELAIGWSRVILVDLGFDSCYLLDTIKSPSFKRVSIANTGSVGTSTSKFWSFISFSFDILAIRGLLQVLIRAWSYYHVLCALTYYAFLDILLLLLLLYLTSLLLMDLVCQHSMLCENLVD